MKNTSRSPDKIAFIWNNPPDCPPPVFPVLYFECLKAQECRGFLVQEHLIGDVDFIGYPLRGEDVLIDSRGQVFHLAFKDFVYPGSLITTLSEKELKESLVPALAYYGDELFINEISLETSVPEIIKKMADVFSW